MRKMVDKKQRGKRSNSEVSSSSSSSTSSFSSDEETDARDLKPIRGYLSNRRELSRQLFKSVKTEKIRMMLPQILKNMNLGELEEWCASELCGMSEARILCILNGQPMLDSSNTSDTDDSGPSLEIISDTEEWLTDTDAAIKEEPSSSGAVKLKRVKANSAKGRARGARKNDQEKSRTKLKGKPTTETVVTVKKEKENRAGANKEGESLLDLLELEMRARAIRALIRKEEDVIPSAASEKRMALTANALRNTLNSAVSASLSNEKSLNGKFSLGESAESSNDKNSVGKSGCSPKRSEVVEDEDVVFVVAQPTPTIELLSSDNDDDDGKDKERKDNKNENKRDVEETSKSARQLNKNDKTPEAVANRDSTTVTSERTVTINKSADGPENLKIVITKRVSESSSSPRSTKFAKSKKLATDRSDKNLPSNAASGNEKSTEKVIAETTQSGKGLFKKIKRKQHLRGKRKIICQDPGTDHDQADDSRCDATPAIGVNETESDKRDDSETAAPRVATVKQEVTESKGSRPKDSATRIDEREVRRKAVAKSDEDRLDDFEEIIDLDAYPEEMDDMENNDEAGSAIEETNGKQSQQTDTQQKTSREETVAKDPSDSTETWASRYYQTDDVQNVIKESKIQSEIRKRLRERQRLSKLNSSPKLSSSADAALVSEKTEESNETKPTGSVQEYLALKNATASPVEANPVGNENSTPVTESPHAAVLPTSNPIVEEPAKTDPPEAETIDRSVLL